MSRGSPMSIPARSRCCDGVFSLATQPLKALRFQRRTMQAMGRRDVGSQALAAILPATANLGAAGLAIVDRVVTSRLPKPVNKEGEVMEAPTLRAPRTIFNGSISPHRRFAFGPLSLDTAKEVKNTFGVTVNDVILAMCGGALRRYLSERDELPDEPLLAMVPVSVRTEEQKGAMGNQVSAMIANLATDEADPVTRLRTIHDGMHIAKQQHKAIPASSSGLHASSQHPQSPPARRERVARAKVVDLVNPPFNVTISNIPGPTSRSTAPGPGLVGSYPVSAIADGLGLNITVMSYIGDLDFGIVACQRDDA